MSLQRFAALTPNTCHTVKKAMSFTVGKSKHGRWSKRYEVFMIESVPELSFPAWTWKTSDVSHSFVGPCQGCVCDGKAFAKSAGKYANAFPIVREALAWLTFLSINPTWSCTPRSGPTLIRFAGFQSPGSIETVEHLSSWRRRRFRVSPKQLWRPDPLASAHGALDVAVARSHTH